MVVKKRVIKKKAKKKRVKKKPAPTTSILDKIQPVSELETNLVMLVYGRSGTGKTHFGSTFPRPCHQRTWH
jgi:RecA/RadA recombinase